jgi:hypothetical protein
MRSMKSNQQTSTVAAFPPQIGSCQQENGVALLSTHQDDLATAAGMFGELLDRYLRCRYHHLLLIYDTPQSLKRRLREIMEEQAGVSFFYFCRIITLLRECEEQGGAMLYLSDTTTHVAVQRLINAFLAGIPQGHEKRSIDTFTIGEQELPSTLSEFLRKLDPERYVGGTMDGGQPRQDRPAAGMPETDGATNEASATPTRSQAGEPFVNEFKAYKQWLLLAPPGLIIAAESMQVFCELIWQNLHAGSGPSRRRLDFTRSYSPASSADRLLGARLSPGMLEAVCGQSSLPSPLGIFLRKSRPSREGPDSCKSRAMPTGGIPLVEVADMIDRFFNEGELKDLCFRIGVDDEDLPGGCKKDKVRELVRHCDRTRTMAVLLEKCRIKRPAETWPTAPSPRMSSKRETSEMNW